MKSANLELLKLVDRSNPHRELLVCLIVAIAFRGAVIWSHADELSHDRDAYLGIARCVAEGKGFVDVDRLTPTAFRPPLYPIQLAGLMTVLPVAAAVAVLNLIWGLVSVWATWRAGQCLGLGFGSILAALLVAVDPMLLQYSAQPMTEVTCAGLVALLVYWNVRSDFSESRRQWGIGLLFGALVLCRPTFWPLAGVVLIAVLVAEVRRIRGWQARSRSLTTSATPGFTFPWRILVGTLLIVGPWVIRNQLVFGSPILMTTHGGYTLLLANNPVFYDEVVDRGWGSEWTKPSFDQWQRDLQTTLISQLGPDTTELDRDRWQSLQARRFIAEEPGRFLKATWYRVRSLWSTTPQSDTAASRNAWLVQLVGWYYTAVLLAFVAGMLVVAVRVCRCGGLPRPCAWWPLFALVLTVQTVHLVYWTNARMRAPIVPVISLFAVAGMGRKCHWLAALGQPVRTEQKP